MKDTEIRIKQRNFSNATVMKFDNRRVNVEQLKDGSIGLVFKIMATPEYTEKVPPPSYEIRRGKIVVTKVRISEEAAFALYHAIAHQLSNRIELTGEGGDAG